MPGEYPLTQRDLPLPDVRRAARGRPRHRRAARTERRGVDEALRRALRCARQWPYGSGVWGKREWVAPERAGRLHRLDRRGRDERSSGPSASAARSALPDLWIKQCGNSHTGSFKDLGMTVLVSVVRQAIAKEGALSVARPRAARAPATRSASLAAYGAAAGLPVAVLLPRGLVSTGAARAAARARRARLRARDRLRRLHGGRQGARAPGPRLPRELDEPAPHRGAEDGRDRDRPAVRLGVARLDRPPERQPRQRGGALRRLQDDAASSGSSRACRASASRRPRTRTRCTAPSSPARTSSSRSHAEPTLASAIQIGNPVSAPRAMAALHAMNGVVEQASEDGARRRLRARRPDGPLHVPAHRRRARRACSSCASAGIIEPMTARRRRLDGERPEVHRVQARATTRRRLPGIAARLANRAVSLAADADEVARAITAS